MSSLVADDTTIERPSAGEEPRLLHQFFEKQVVLRPESPAVACGGEVLTYSQLDRLAERIAASLQARGIGRGSLVGLYLDKSCRLFAAMLGVLKAGAGYVPLDPNFPISRVQSILQDASILAVISDGELGQNLASQTATEVVFLSREPNPGLGASASYKPVAVAPDDVCYVIYTSGSTGRPKGVIIEHRNAVNFVRSLPTVYRLTARDRVYQGFSIAFDASVEEIWGALAVGGTLVVPPSEIARSAFDAAEFINSQKITFFSTVPSFLAMIRADLPTVKLLVVGGESCPPELVHRWATPERRMMNTYGPTEATVVATATDCTPDQPVTIGTALPGYAVYVFDEQLRPINPGESGELYIGGDCVARGYLNRPELTAERFITMAPGQQAGASTRLYRTRDLVRLTETGALQFLGRADTQIKIRGFRIELSEIEAVLMEHPSIQVASVNVVEFGTLKELSAYVMLESHVHELDRDSVANLLRSKLPEYMIPRYLDVVDDLPLMTSGKVDKKLLPPPCMLLGRARPTIVAPLTDIERAIVKIWEDLFQISPISIDDDFFLDLRGHSLLAAHAVTELRAKLGTVHVSVPDLYEYRTVRLLAQHLERAGIAAPTTPTPPQPPDSFIPPGARAPLPWFRFPCAVLQLLGLLALYTALFAPIALAVVVALKVRDGELDLIHAVDIATTVSFFIWPTWLILSIALKWIVIGRYKAGRHPVWGFYYFRWWLVSRFQALSLSPIFVGTPLMSLYYRAMGAKIGKHCSIDTPLCTAFDLVSIGDDTSIGSETHMLGYRIENGWLILGTITIGSECFVGTHCCLGLNTKMGNRSRLDDLSHLADDAAIEADQGMCGSPARAATVDLDVLQTGAEPGRTRLGRAFLYGIIHLILIYAMGYLLILSTLPGLILALYALYAWGLAWGVAASFAAIPMSFLWYLLVVVAVKRIAIGRIFPGVYRQYSADYLRYWFLAYLLTNTRHIALPLYATLFLPPFLRLLGARIGRGVEISTAMHIMPDLLEIGDGSFLADACIVGGHRSYLGRVELRPNRIGKRSFIGNSALVPVGIDIGDNALIGVMSAPPRGVKRTADGARWLGSPSFQLPHTQEVGGFSDAQTYSPSAWRVALRLAVEVLRLLLPGILAVAHLIAFCANIALAYYLMPFWALALAGPIAVFILSFATVALVAALKRLFIGTFVPVVKPLWSAYVWFNEVVNAIYETVAASAMTPLMGTPFISSCLRMMGCKVGRWVFLETTLFSEFDLVIIGDYAALNLGATIQTHLFEDRVMKSDYLKIGDMCSVGNMAVVLYDTEMQRGSSLGALSVLMKGEVLPAASCWAGIPTRPIKPSMAVAALARVAAAPARPERRASREQLISERVDWFLATSGRTVPPRSEATAGEQSRQAATTPAWRHARS